MKVAIIGGGIAGLSAAMELLRHEVAVTILEAKRRLGGRIHTIHDLGFPIELGAEFLHGQTEAIQETIRAARLETSKVSERRQLFENGRFYRSNLLGKISDIIHRVNPRAPDCSFQEFLNRQKLDDRDRRLATAFVNGYDAARAERISTHALLRGQIAAEKMEDTAQSRIREGYSALVDFLAENIRSRAGKFELGAVVKTIRWKRGRVEVQIQIGRLRKTFKADAAVITLPLGVLKSGAVEFDPPLAKKREAVAGLEFGNVIKMILVFRQQWWRNFGFIHAIGEPISAWWTDPRGPMLTGWAGGPKADALLRRPAAELEAIALKTLGKMFSERVSSLGTKLLAAHTYNWAGDPHIRGAYSYIPVNGLDLPKLLAEPAGETLFFAGEATASDAEMGTVSAAFESGLRAARELLNR